MLTDFTDKTKHILHFTQTKQGILYISDFTEKTRNILHYYSLYRLDKTLLYITDETDKT